MSKRNMFDIILGARNMRSELPTKDELAEKPTGPGHFVGGGKRQAEGIRSGSRGHTVSRRRLWMFDVPPIYSRTRKAGDISHKINLYITA